MAGSVHRERPRQGVAPPIEPPADGPTSAAGLGTLRTSLGLDRGDAARLAALAPAIAADGDAIADRFYDALSRCAVASDVFATADARRAHVGQLRSMLGELPSMGEPSDREAGCVERRIQFGRHHLRLGVQQHHMIAAMTAVREGLVEAWFRANPSRDQGDDVVNAIGRACAIDLALVLEAYRDSTAANTRRQERLATLGHIAASIGHELRNPLAVMETSLSLIRRRIGDDERILHHLDRIHGQIDTCGTIINDLLEMARDREPNRTRVALHQIARDAVAAVSLPESIAVTLAIDESVGEAMLDAGQMRQVLVNLLTNAIQAMSGQAGTITVGASRIDDVLIIEVDDEGSGIDEESVGRLFEPLFTTRNRGVGLGLSLCQRIVHKHGGTIAASARPQGGARFRITLPDDMETP